MRHGFGVAGGAGGAGGVGALAESAGFDAGFGGGLCAVDFSFWRLA